jgi:hypothetical protein
MREERGLFRCDTFTIVTPVVVVSQCLSVMIRDVARTLTNYLENVAWTVIFLLLRLHRDLFTALSLISGVI